MHILIRTLRERWTVAVVPGAVHGEVEQAEAAETVAAEEICASPAQDG